MWLGAHESRSGWIASHASAFCALIARDDGCGRVLK
jgi:hypothetical protein